MNLEEISEIARQGIDVQLHTHRHRTPRDETMFKAEITENQRILQNATGICPRHFCYPSGDYDSRFLPWLTQLGIESATTCDVALAATRDNSLLLPRFVDTMGQGDIAFQGWLSGVAHVVSRRHASSH